MKASRVGVVGAGYVGLVTGACLAYLGHEVDLVDSDRGKVAGLERGELLFYEPGLAELIAEVRDRLRFTTDLAPVVCGADVLFVAVGTPQKDDGSADLSRVAEVARGIGRALAGAPREDPLVVVNKSTVPAGGGDYISMLVRDGAEEAGGKAEVLVISNPEFLREGSAVYDTFYPDRIIVGTDSGEALDVLRKLYEPIICRSFPGRSEPSGTVPFVATDLASAEMIKYAANAFLATKVSFINEISNVCELLGADVEQVARGIGLDVRIGPRYLNAGIGWGGSCLPKDVSALRASAHEYGLKTDLLDAVVSVNVGQRQRVIRKLQDGLRTLKGKRVALLGLAFKPGTDDLRDAPSLEIARALDSLGARVVGYDPVVDGRAGPAPEIVTDPYEALEGAHAAVVVTEWEEVRRLDLVRAADLMRKPRIFVDGRNALDPRKAAEAGLLYRGFGRG